MITDEIAGDSLVILELLGGIAKPDMKVLEVGCWMGRMTKNLATMVARHNGKVFVVDHFQGNPDVKRYNEPAQRMDIYQVFKKNMIACRVWDWIYPLVMDSQTASSIFADDSLDFIFLDADYRYEYYKADLINWFPKLKTGGILCGHGAEGYYSNLCSFLKRIVNRYKGESIRHFSTKPERLRGLNLSDKFKAELNAGKYEGSETRLHTGLIRALYDVFKDKHKIIGHSTTWCVVK